MKKKIGILAGMGPRSTSPFLEMVLDQCQKQYNAKYDIDYPHILIYSLPTPFYIDRVINHDEMKKTIKNGLKDLEKSGVDYIAMPCNSAHIYFDEIKESIKIPLMNIVDETIKKIKDKNKKITIFSTEVTMKSEIYQKGIQKSQNNFYFKKEWQKTVNKIIQMVKNNENKENIEKEWIKLIKEVKENKVEYIIIACTDLSMLKNDFKMIKIIDSSKSLAESVIKKYLH